MSLSMYSIRVVLPTLSFHLTGVLSAISWTLNPISSTSGVQAIRSTNVSALPAGSSGGMTARAIAPAGAWHRIWMVCTSRKWWGNCGYGGEKMGEGTNSARFGLLSWARPVSARTATSAHEQAAAIQKAFRFVIPPSVVYGDSHQCPRLPKYNGRGAFCHPLNLGAGFRSPPGAPVVVIWDVSAF